MKLDVKRSRILLKLPILIWIVWCVAGGPLWAEGRFTLNTFLDTSWRRDDNFYKAADEERSVDTTAVSPGLSFGYNTAKSVIEMNYLMNAFFYDDQDPVGENRPSDDDNYQEHILNLAAQTQLTPRLRLGVTEGYIRTRDPAQADVYNNSVDRRKYMMNRLTPEIYYSFADRFSAELKYRYGIVDYIRSNEGEDSDENRVIGSFHYLPNPDLDFFLEYQYWNTDYEKTTSDYDSSRYSLNFKNSYRVWVFTGGIGYQEREFDNPGLEKMDTVAWNLGVTFGEQGGNAYLFLGVDQDFNNLGIGNAYYTGQSLRCNAGYILMEKIDLSARGMYQKSDYELYDREDDTWMIALKGDYRFQEFLVVGLEYGIESRDSNLNPQDYDNRFIMGHIRLAYDWGAR